MNLKDLLFKLGIKTKNKTPYKVLEYNLKKVDCFYNKLDKFCTNKQSKGICDINCPLLVVRNV